MMKKKECRITNSTVRKKELFKKKIRALEEEGMKYRQVGVCVWLMVEQKQTNGQSKSIKNGNGSTGFSTHSFSLRASCPSGCLRNVRSEFGAERANVINFDFSLNFFHFESKNKTHFIIRSIPSSSSSNLGFNYFVCLR